jgi:hypothetical protein
MVCDCSFNSRETLPLISQLAFTEGQSTIYHLVDALSSLQFSLPMAQYKPRGDAAKTAVTTGL